MRYGVFRLFLLALAASFSAVLTFVLITTRFARKQRRVFKLPNPVRSRHARVAVVVREAIAIHRLMLWHLFFWENSPRHSRTPSNHPVLCVHGFSQNGTNWRVIRKALARRGRASSVVFLGHPGRPLARYAQVLIAALQSTPNTVDVVCHSMGGLVLRRALADEPSLATRIGRVVTIGTPHDGTASAGRDIRSLPEVTEMRYLGDAIAKLPKLRDLLPHHPVTTIGSDDDTTVFPVASALNDGDLAIQVDGYGHTSLLMAAEPVAAVLHALSRPAPQDMT